MFVTLIGVTYSWFSNVVDGEGNEIGVTTARLGIIYTDGPETKMKNAYPGQSVTKTFEVENTSEETFTYEIYLKDIVNTFINNELVFTLSEETQGELISEEPIGKEIMLSSIAIDKEETHRYTLTIKFKETGSNQNSNMGVSFRGTIQIRESHIVEVEHVSGTYNSITVRGKGSNFKEIEGYSFSKDNGVTWTPIQPSDTYTFTGLTMDTEYDIKVRVKEDNEYTLESGTLKERTNIVEPPTVTLTTQTKTYNSITVTAEAEDPVVGIKSNTYEFSKDNGITWTIPQTSNTYTFTGLTSNTGYQIKVRVQNNLNITGTSQSHLSTTDVLLPPTITLTSPSKTYNSVSLTASASDNQSGINPNTYQFSSDNGITWSGVQSTNTYTYTGLTSGTTYNFKARIQNNGGATGTSTTLSVVTDTLLSPTITLMSSGKTKNSVTLISNASDTQTGINQNTYQFSSDNGLTWSGVQGSNVYTFTGLTGGTTYYFKARIQNNGGLVGDSSALAVTTDPELAIASFTGNHTTSEDATYKYVKFLTSGTVTFNTSGIIDVFLVGGGGRGANPNGGGGGGGFTKTYKNVSVGGTISVEIGDGAGSWNSIDGVVTTIGGKTSFGVLEVLGGLDANGTTGGEGGSGGGGGTSSQAYYGGAGGSNGSSGENAGLSQGGPGKVIYGGAGQGTTTRAFEEPTGELYAGGGGGYSAVSHGGQGGAGGGGEGGNGSNNLSNRNGIANTGGGGGGGSGNGGSGIVIIRWLK